MRFKIEINLLALHNMKSKINLEEAVLLDYLYWLCSSPSEEVEKNRINKDDKKYTWFDYEFYIQETPIIRGKTKGSITPKIKKLEEEGFIKTIIIGAELYSKKYVRLLPKTDRLFRKLNEVVQKTKQRVVQKTKPINKLYKDDNKTKDNTKRISSNELVNYFFELKGWANKDKDFYQKKRIIYSRFTRPAKELFQLCDGDIKEAKYCLKKVADWAISRELDWSIETVFKKWYDLDKLKTKEKKAYYNGNRVFQMGGKSYVLMPNGEKLEFVDSKEKLIYK